MQFTPFQYKLIAITTALFAFACNIALLRWLYTHHHNYCFWAYLVVWAGMAITQHIQASILKRRTRKLEIEMSVAIASALAKGQYATRSL